MVDNYIFQMLFSSGLDKDTLKTTHNLQENVKYMTFILRGQVKVGFCHFGGDTTLRLNCEALHITFVFNVIHSFLIMLLQTFCTIDRKYFPFTIEV